MARTNKLEIRVDEVERESMDSAAAKAGYGEREFSRWARRVLLGLEEHPNGKRKKAQTKTS